MENLAEMMKKKGLDWSVIVSNTLIASLLAKLDQKGVLNSDDLTEIIQNAREQADLILKAKG